MENQERMAQIDQVVFGCHSLASLSFRGQALNLLRAAWGQGIRHFDTAPLYSRGYSESLLGQAFKGRSDVRLTSKIGIYAVPKTRIPVAFAMPLNALRRRQDRREPSSAGDTSYTPPACLESSPIEHILNHLMATLGRLRVTSLKSYLLHEIGPSTLPVAWQRTLINLQSQGLISRLGYGGEFSDELLTTSLPDWVSVLQVPFPFQNPTRQKQLISWLDRNTSRQLRLFGLFRSEDHASQIKQIRSLLDHHPNMSVLFSCRSEQRLAENLESLLG